MAGEEGRVGEEAAGGHEAGEICVAGSWLLLLCCGGSTCILGVFFDGEGGEVGDSGGGFDGEGCEVEDVAREEDRECAGVLFCENLEGFGTDGRGGGRVACSRVDGDPVDEAVLGVSDDCIEEVHCSPEFWMHEY